MVAVVIQYLSGPTFFPVYQDAARWVFDLAKRGDDVFVIINFQWQALAGCFKIPDQLSAAAPLNTPHWVGDHVGGVSHPSPENIRVMAQAQACRNLPCGEIVFVGKYGVTSHGTVWCQTLLQDCAH